MAGRELKKLSRADLLELLLEQSQRREQLEQELEDARKELEDRTLKIDKAGTLAEACLQINGVFEAVHASCRQYLENIERLSREQEELRNRAEQLLKETEEKCRLMEAQTQLQCEARLQQAEQKNKG